MERHILISSLPARDRMIDAISGNGYLRLEFFLEQGIICAAFLGRTTRRRYCRRRISCLLSRRPHIREVGRCHRAPSACSLASSFLHDGKVTRTNEVGGKNLSLPGRVFVKNFEWLATFSCGGIYSYENMRCCLACGRIPKSRVKLFAREGEPTRDRLKKKPEHLTGIVLPPARYELHTSRVSRERNATRTLIAGHFCSSVFLPHRVSDVFLLRFEFFPLLCKLHPMQAAGHLDPSLLLE